MSGDFRYVRLYETYKLLKYTIKYIYNRYLESTHMFYTDFTCIQSTL